MTSRGNMLNFLDSARAYMDTALQRPGTAPCRSVNLRRFLQRNILKRPATVRPAQPGPIRQCRRRKSTATTTTSASASSTTSSASVYTSSAKASVFTSSTKASQSAAKASSSAAACVKSGNKGLPLPHSQPFPVPPASQASSPQCPVMLRINDDLGNPRLQTRFSEIQHSVRGNPPLVIDTRNTSLTQACGVGSRYSEHYSNPSCAFSSHGGFHQSVQTGPRLSECGQTPHPGHSIDNGCGELLFHPDASSAGYFDLPVTNSDLCATEVTSTLPLPFHSHSGQETFGYRRDAFVPVYNCSSWEDQRNPFANVTGPGFPSPAVAAVNCGYDDRNDSVFSSNAQQHNVYYENSSGVHRKTLPVVGNAEDLYQYSSREPNLGTMRSNARVHDGTHLNVIETDADEALALPFCVTGHSYLEHVFNPGSMLNCSVPNSLHCSFSSIPDIDPSLFEGQDIMDIGDNQDMLEMGSSLMDVSVSTSHDLHTAEGCVLSDLSNGAGGNAASTVTSMPRSTLVVSHVGKVLSTAVVKPSLETPKSCLEQSFAHNETDRTDLGGRVSHFRHNTWPPTVETQSCAEAAVTSTHLHDSRGRQTVFGGSSELLSLQRFGPEPQHEYCVSNSWDTSVSTAVPDCNSFIQSTSCYQPLLQYITQNECPPLLTSLSSFEDKDAANKLPMPSVASDLVVRYSADNHDSDQFELFDEEDCLDKLLEALEQVEGAAPVDSSEEDAHVEFDPNNEEDIEPLMNLLRDRQENVVSAACQDISENTASQRTLLNEIHVGDSLLNTLLCPRSALPTPGRSVEDTQCLRATNQLGCVIPAEDFMTSAASEEMFDENSAPVFSACSVPMWKFGPQGHQSTLISHRLPSAVSHVSKSVASSSCGTQPVKSQRSLSLVIPPTSLPLPLGSMSHVTAFPSSGLPDTSTSTPTVVLSKEPHVSPSSMQAQVPAPQSLRIIPTVMQAQGIQEKQPAAETPKLLVLSSPNSSSQQSSPIPCREMTAQTPGKPQR